MVRPSGEYSYAQAARYEPPFDFRSGQGSDAALDPQDGTSNLETAIHQPEIAAQHHQQAVEGITNGFDQSKDDRHPEVDHSRPCATSSRKLESLEISATQIDVMFKM